MTGHFRQISCFQAKDCSARLKLDDEPRKAKNKALAVAKESTVTGRGFNRKLTENPKVEYAAS